MLSFEHVAKSSSDYKKTEELFVLSIKKDGSKYNFIVDYDFLCEMKTRFNIESDGSFYEDECWDELYFSTVPICLSCLREMVKLRLTESTSSTEIKDLERFLASQ